MTKKRNWSQELEQVAVQLRDPFRMRIAVVGVTLAIMFFAISNPLHGKMKRSQREMARLKQSTTTAEEVLLLRSHLDNVDQRIVHSKSNDVIVSHVIDIARGQQVDLLRIDAEAPDRMGPLHSVRVTLEVTGSFQALTGLLHRLESDQYLIRIETVAISPPRQDQPHPSMQLSIRTIKDPS